MSMDNMITFNLKLKRDIKDRFKKITRTRGTTMQSILAAFTESFVHNPDQFRIKMEVVDVKVDERDD